MDHLDQEWFSLSLQEEHSCMLKMWRDWTCDRTQICNCWISGSQWTVDTAMLYCAGAAQWGQWTPTDWINWPARPATLWVWSLTLWPKSQRGQVTENIGQSFTSSPWCAGQAQGHIQQKTHSTNNAPQKFLICGHLTWWPCDTLASFTCHSLFILIVCGLTLKYLF